MVKLRFQLFSDIHIELANRVPKIPNLAPYLFLAGDIGKKRFMFVEITNITVQINLIQKLIKHTKSFLKNTKILCF